MVARLKTEGVNQLAICGGATVYTQFLQAGLVDELFLTVHPTIFGTGVPLFNAEVGAKLQLIEAKNIGDDTILLHYNVVAS
ncbi:MAG TPA: dihydrofolate reductase family protein [Candidatus Saccharimonas sp.]|nr:dihydrofolate reductase family protein [Candidatus Saccharimonas sp.]